MNTNTFVGGKNQKIKVKMCLNIQSLVTTLNVLNFVCYWMKGACDSLEAITIEFRCILWTLLMKVNTILSNYTTSSSSLQ